MNAIRTLFLFCTLSTAVMSGCTRVYIIAISGKVVDAATNEPIQGVAIGIKESRASSENTVTDAQGRFLIHVESYENDFEGKTPSWTLVFDSPEYKQLSCEIDLASLSQKPKSIDTIIVINNLVRKE